MPKFSKIPKYTEDGHYATDVPLVDLQHFVNPLPIPVGSVAKLSPTGMILACMNGGDSTRRVDQTPPPLHPSGVLHCQRRRRSPRTRRDRHHDGTAQRAAAGDHLPKQQRPSLEIAGPTTPGYGRR